MSNVMDVKEDGGWRSRVSAVLGFFAVFVTLIPLLRSALGVKIPTGTTVPGELTYYKYGLLCGVGGTITGLIWGKGFAGWRLAGIILSAFGIALAVSFLMLLSFTDSFNSQ
jgi:hypothetical protein